MKYTVVFVTQFWISKSRIFLKEFQLVLFT